MRRPRPQWAEGGPRAAAAAIVDEMDSDEQVDVLGELPDDAMFAGLPIVLVPLIHVATPVVPIAKPACSARISMPSVAIPESIAANVAVPPPRVAA